MAAVGGSTAIYRFVFAADAGDSWGGWFVAAAGSFTAGARLRTEDGTYTVLTQVADGFDGSLFGLQEGQVFVDWYRDGASAAFLPIRLGPSIAAGTAGLGSEVGAAWTGEAWMNFGLGGALQAESDRDSYFGWRFQDVLTGDFYAGWTIEDSGRWAPGTVIQAARGFYVIDQEIALGRHSGFADGTLWITGYFDAGSGRFLDTYNELVGEPSGIGGLGSETDAAFTGRQWDWFGFGDTHWVDAS